MAENFEKEFQVDNTDDLRGIKKFHFKKLWYDGYINLKYAITPPGLDPFYMVRNDQGEWKFENPDLVPLMCHHLRGKFGNAIEENESQAAKV